MNIDLTEFWIKNSPRPLSNCSNFSILSNWYVNFSSCYYGNGKVFRYQDGVKKYQLSCIVLEDTFYLDFSAAHLKDNILQQMWILKHTTGIEYKLKMKCLWELFNLPTVEQLNAFAKIKVEQHVVPQVSNDYAFSVEEMRLSTGLDETLLLTNIALPLSEYIDLMLRMTHTRLNDVGVIHHATVIHNHHNPVIQPVTVSEPNREYTEARDLLMEYSSMTSSDLNPTSSESLADYLESLEGEVELPYNDILHYGTIVYNYNRGVITEGYSEEELEELEPETLDHPF